MGDQGKETFSIARCLSEGEKSQLSGQDGSGAGTWEKEGVWGGGGSGWG